VPLQNTTRVLLPLLLLLFTVVGCGPTKGQVAGKVVWSDGSPAKELANGQVIFESAELRISARGVIQPDGAFRIDTESTSDGILLGTYKVAIVEHRPAAEGETKLPPQHLPNKYYVFETSGLSATVNSGTNNITLTVDRMPGKK
jgi:hypothetical protein